MRLLHPDVVLLVVSAAPHLLAAAVVVTYPLERMSAAIETATMTVVTEVIALAAQMIGKIYSAELWWKPFTDTKSGTVMSRMTVTMIARTAQMTKTGKVNCNSRAVPRTKLADTRMAAAVDSPPPERTHDELDIAE